MNGLLREGHMSRLFKITCDGSFGIREVVIVAKDAAEAVQRLKQLNSAASIAEAVLLWEGHFEDGRKPMTQRDFYQWWREECQGKIDPVLEPEYRHYAERAWLAALIEAVAYQPGA